MQVFLSSLLIIFFLQQCMLVVLHSMIFYVLNKIFFLQVKDNERGKRGGGVPGVTGDLIRIISFTLPY